MDATILLNPIATAPQDPVPLLLYCPDEGSWLLGLWSKGAWRLQGHRERILNPTHWLPMSTEVVVESAHQQKGSAVRSARDGANQAALRSCGAAGDRDHAVRGVSSPARRAPCL